MIFATTILKNTALTETETEEVETLHDMINFYEEVKTDNEENAANQPPKGVSKCTISS